MAINTIQFATLLQQKLCRLIGRVLGYQLALDCLLEN